MAVGDESRASIRTDASGRGVGGGDDVGRVKDEARSAISSTKDEARSAISSTKDEALDRAEGHKQDVADRLARAADHVHRSADELRGDERWLADLMDQGSGQLNNFAQSLKQRDLGGLLQSVEDFARRQPGAFMGASIALGFALGRLAKSSTGGARPSGATGTRDVGVATSDTRGVGGVGTSDTRGVGGVGTATSGTPMTRDYDPAPTNVGGPRVDSLSGVDPLPGGTRP